MDEAPASASGEQNAAGEPPADGNEQGGQPGAQGPISGGSAVRKVDPPLSSWRVWVPRQWPLLFVLFGLIVSLAVVVLEHFRPGTLMFSGCVLLAALFRLVLPDRKAGLLVLRTRTMDVLTLLLLGLIILVLAVAVPELPPGGLPATSQ